MQVWMDIGETDLTNIVSFQEVAMRFKMIVYIMHVGLDWNSYTNSYNAIKLFHMSQEIYRRFSSFGLCFIIHGTASTIQHA